MRQKRRSGLFAYSAWDGMLVMISAGHAALVLWVAANFAALSLTSLLLLGLVCAYLTLLNHQCVSHNSIHNPFFVSKALNRAFNIFNSIGMGGPSSINHVEHVIHHKYNNDMRGSDGKTKDNLSIFRFGKTRGPEPLWRYALATHLRLTLTTDYSRKGRAIKEEWVLVIAFWAILVWLAPFSLLWYLASAFLGMVLSAVENYAEHLNGVPGDRMRDSVSVYNRVYNFLWFNNGYHQEHHFRPNVHWLDMATVTPLLPSDRHCVKYCHFNNLKLVVDYERVGKPDQGEDFDPGIEW